MSHPIHCKRCGKCCIQGGPALHSQDLKLIKEKIIGFRQMVTIRPGELAIPPLGQEAEPVKNEFLKLQGSHGDWSCLFYDMNHAQCTIYSHRPVACRVLECAAPEALLAITGKNLLTRFHCIAQDDPILPLVKEHASACPCPDLANIKKQREQNTGDNDIIKELQDTVDLDLQYRNAAARIYETSVSEEIFYFGRPLFQLLIPLGIKVYEKGEKIKLR